MELIALDKLKTCKCCKRTFQFSINDKGFCPTCDLAYNHRKLINEKFYKSLYSKYAGVLPLQVRVNTIKEKYAFEDDEIVILVVGQKKYLLNKSGIPTKGYISSDFIKKIEG
jgi:hypothetical protein